jgi:hypothetical protein
MHTYSVLLIAMYVDGSVGMETGYGPALEVRFPTGAKDSVYITAPLPTVGLTQLLSSLYKEGSFPEDIAARCLKLASHLHLVTRS